ncbi:MAG: hypothetical protein ABII75_09000 [Candidatus Omnitrophota bacterium]
MQRKTFKIKLRQIISLLTLLSILSVLTGILLFKAYLNSYHVFTDKTLAAKISCRQDKISKEKFLEVELLLSQKYGEKMVLSFNSADEWVIEGRIIKWKDFFTLFGAKSYWRLERIRSRFYDIQAEKRNEAFIFNLQDSPDRVWFFIYGLKRFLPFIDAVYGSSAFVPFESGRDFEVYVTKSGLLIKDVTLPARRIWWSTG